MPAEATGCGARTSTAEFASAGRTAGATNAAVAERRLRAAISDVPRREVSTEAAIPTVTRGHPISYSKQSCLYEL
eukprot:scaffold35220_cov34-Tisochrysis_lutea.AAC.2